MPPKNVFLCFDAFGTLFKPRFPIAQQYGEVARSLGLVNVKDEDVGRSFKAAFKQESKQNPNYGKKTGLNAEKWWSRIIVNTFTPLIPTSQKLPIELVPKLLHRFSSSEGYVLFPDVQPLLRQIQKARTKDLRIVIGVITNSDDRVPEILSSLGVKVSPLRFPSKERLESLEQFDIHFSVMSYDVGHEKPSSKIFDAAGDMLLSSLGADGHIERDEWHKIYVGDDEQKDAQGALGSGWSAVLIDREAGANPEGFQWIDDSEVPTNGYESIEQGRPVGVRSLEGLARWLPH